jgi:hypothetical protein
MRTDLDPRSRRGDSTGDFHLLGWAAGPSTLRVGMTSSTDLFQHGAKDWKSRDRQAEGRGWTNSEFTIHHSQLRIALARSWNLTPLERLC